MTRTRLPAVRVAPSGLHGQGLFADEDIPADVCILPLVGRPTGRDGPHVLWIEEEEGPPRGLRLTNEARYVNHARDANAALYDEGLYSLRSIRKGEEITHDYGPDWT